MRGEQLDGFESPGRTARVYEHAACRRQTVIRGYAFERLACPFEFAPGGTICSACQKAVPLRQVRWTDTGEVVADYRRRLRRATPVGRRILYSLLGPLAGALIGFVLGAV